MTVFIFAFISLAIGGMLGIILGKGVASLFRAIIRATDKAKMQTAMMNATYLNDLYEECLYERQDRLAKKAAKEMSYYDR